MFEVGNQMKSDAEIADEPEAGMEDALERMTEVQIEIAEIYASTMLYAYSKWLGMRYSSKNLVQEFLEYLEYEATNR